MIAQLCRAEWLKIKRKGLWLLAFIGPVGVIAMQMVNYGVRKDYLLAQSEDDWAYYLTNVSSFTPLALMLGIVILTSLMASIEDETNAWKQWIALPVSKYSVFASKFIVVTLLLLVSTCLLALFTYIYGTTLGLGENIPWSSMLTQSFYPFLASLALIAVHLWIATISPNQGTTITTGILGVIVSMMGAYLPDWFIWKWPTLMNAWDNPFVSAALGVSGGFVLLIVGMWDFNRRDVS